MHVQVAPIRYRLALAGAVVAGSLSAASRDAHACGATPVEVQPLLPLDGATNVPLNAVLFSSSNLREAVFELHEVLDDASDAGPSGAVQLSVDCSARGQGGGAVCLARPIEPLKPNTRYAWHTNVVVPDGYSPDYFEGLSREFTTGSALDDQPISADAVRLIVTENHQETANPCGINRWMDVAYPLRASEPGVLHFADFTPSYIMHATLLAGGSGAAATATLYMQPTCLAPVLYDGAGHRTELPEWCPGDAAPPAVPWETSDDANDAPMGPPGSSTSPAPPAASPVAARRERPLCTLSMPPTPTSRALPTAAGLGLALLLAERRRRR